MSETLFPYYERELVMIRRMAQEFAKQYPAAAGRLMLEPNRSGDPHIERLIESFALLAGRIHNKIDDEFPELTDALLNVLYPHYLAPVPSTSIVQFVLDPTRGQFDDGFEIPLHSQLQTHRVGDLPCTFRTGYPVKLWPIELTGAQFKPPPFPPGLYPPRRSAAALRMQFECQSKSTFGKMSLETLRFYLSGDNPIIADLYDLIFNHATQVVFRSLDEDSKIQPVILSAEKALAQVGFEPEDALLPYPQRSFPGYRLLSEFFAFPSKFLFMDLKGWDQVCQRKFGTKVEVIIFLNRTEKNLEEWVDETTFRMGATPVINLFRQVAEPIPLSHRKFEYAITPDVGHQVGMEVFSVDGVTSNDLTTGEVTKYEPFYSYRHTKTRENSQTFWYATRRLATKENDRGTDMFLSLVDQGFEPKLPATAAVMVETTCTNRNLPMQLQHAGERLYFGLTAPAPLQKINCLRTPSPPLRPRLQRGAYWGLVSHLSLNHLSISDPVEGRATLQEILRLYDFSDPSAGQQQLSEVNRQLIEGITGISSRRVVGRVRDTLSSGYCKGLEVTLELDEEKYVGTSIYLFASVLERFLGLYASINSFSQLVAKTSQTEGYFKKWPPRTADLQLL